MCYCMCYLKKQRCLYVSQFSKIDRQNADGNKASQCAAVWVVIDLSVIRPTEVQTIQTTMIVLMAITHCCRCDCNHSVDHFDDQCLTENDDSDNNQNTFKQYRRFC